MEESQDQNSRKEPGCRNGTRNCGGMLFTDLPSMTCSACFLICPPTTYSPKGSTGHSDPCLPTSTTKEENAHKLAQRSTL